MTKDELLEITHHRPFPLPESPWVMQQTWVDLLFLHYKVPYDILRSLIPSELEIDTFEGESWISFSPFKMRNVKIRWLPPIPTTYNFLELNFRTYVKYNGRSGIYFFSLDASSTLSTFGARAAFLPYFRASMEVTRNDGQFRFRSERKGANKVPAVFDASYKPAPGKTISEPGTIEHWLVERYCLFQEAYQNKIIEIDIHHLPWQLQDADVVVEKNNLAEPFDFEIPDQKPLIHYSEMLKVLVWPLRAV